MTASNLMIAATGLAKAFTVHAQGGVRIPVLDGVDLEVRQGESVVLDGPSGVGKSTLLRCLYGNYLVARGSVKINQAGTMVEMVGAAPRTVLALRHDTLGYVSQFLRAIPRVSTLALVVEAGRTAGLDEEEAQTRACDLLTRLNVGERLWRLPPATFSGGEQQRVNIARSFVVDYPILLLDEPTASLDAENRRVVIDLIVEARTRGAAIVGIFHDAEVRAAVATRRLPMTALEAAA